MQSVPVISKAEVAVVWIVRLLLGIVFIVSGFSKLMDPFGTFYKLTEYIAIINAAYLHPILPLISILLPAVELTFGINVLLGTHRKTTSLGVLLFMLFMTPLTLYIALFNPVPDCGCFGDLIVISNTETFLKNIPLLAGSIYFFVRKVHFKSLYTYHIQWLTEIFTLSFSLLIGWNSWHHLPLVDIFPFKQGVNILEAMRPQEGAVGDRYKTILVYEKDGEKHEFTEDNFPADDSTWTFVDARSTLVKRGERSLIEPFSVTDVNGQDLTDTILGSSGYSVLLTIPHLSWVNMTNIDRIDALNDYCLMNNIPFTCLTASLPTEIDEWIEETGCDYMILNADENILKTIVRSTPGVVLLKDGTIIKKWSSYDIPEEAEFKDLTKLENEKLPPPGKTYERFAIHVVPFLLILLLTALFEKTILLIIRKVKFFRSIKERKEEIEKSDI